MLFRGSISIAIAVLLASIATAQAFDDAKYPDFFGVWRRVNFRVGGQPSFDQTKPWGRGQQAPLTPEYQAIHEASLADQANGGQGNWQSGARCMPPGMPASMNVYGEMEIVVLPEVTHILLNHNSGLSSTHLHRWTGLAEGGRAELPGLFDRQMDRCGRQRPFQPAGSRDAPLQGPAGSGPDRPAGPCRQPVDREGAHLFRQGRSDDICTTRSRCSTMPTRARGPC